MHSLTIWRLLGWIGEGCTTVEGGIMLEAVRKLSRRGIAAYPIHDSLLVARQHKNVAHNILSDCFHDAAGLSPILKWA